jgi:aminopeptidase N
MGQVVTTMAVRSFLAWSALSMAAGAAVGGENEVWPHPPRDIHSFGNPQQVRVTEVRLKLQVDFNRKELREEADLDVERRPGAAADAPLVLDTADLRIVGVWSRSRGKEPAPARFSLGTRDRILGTPLTVSLPGDATTVRITYRTSPDATALQWLDAPLTAGKKQPFLFTQSQAIHARSWIPIQDSPGVRVTYEARVEVPDGLTAVMGAEHLAGDRNVFRFRMPHPIPPYLIALAVGDLAFRPLGARTGVYAEKPVVEAAAREFAETEAMISAVEKRYGPYRWGRYDLLVLPPSFPFGGMENPMLTFATPTVIAGDRSLVSLVAHELAHSWSGNLVTNATWSDFWLNEGFTTYIERRVVEDLYGADRAAMEAVLGLERLRSELKTLPPKDQVLHIDLSGRDPDDAVTAVPYEKGALFLTALERAFGRERFDEFLRGYFAHFAFRSLTTAEFEAYLRRNLLALDENAARSVDVHEWVYEPGLPKGHPEATSERFAAVERAARDWLERKRPAAAIDVGSWSTQEWLHFLQALPETLPAERMAELDAAFHLTDRGNAEVAHHWLLAAVRNHYTRADDRLESFLTTVGRRKLVLPLYAELSKTPEGKARAKAIFAKARPSYHPITTQSVDRLLNKTN